MQVAIDSSKCQGHGRCVLIAPDVFDIDDDGDGVVTQITVPASLESDVSRAVAICPESAISLD